MRLYREGERSVGICENCKAKVHTRMEYRDFTPPGSDVTVPDVLVSVCERCGEVDSIPHQSTPKINEYCKTRDRHREAIECRVSRTAEDAVDLMTAMIGGERGATRQALFRFYLYRMAQDVELARAVKRSVLEGGDESAREERRISLKVPGHRWRSIWEAAQAAGIASKSELVRGVIGLACSDFEVAGATLGHRPRPAGVSIQEVEADLDAAAKERRGGLKLLAEHMA